MATPAEARRRWSWPALRPSALFLAVWALFDVTLNLRYPGQELAFWYLLPSFDIVILFLYMIFFARLGWRVHPLLRGGVVGWLLLARALRIADGLEQLYYAQRFNVYTDLQLVPEAVRFLHSTLPFWKFYGILLITAGALFLLGALYYRALRYCEAYLSVLENQLLFGAVSVACFGVGLAIASDPYYKDLFRGGFGSSVTLRMADEVHFLLNVYGVRAKQTQLIARTQTTLEHTPHDLAKLEHRNVHLILVESYGQTVIERPYYIKEVGPTFDAFERELGARGFSIVSTILDSPTYGGRSWLAHSTIATGVRTTNELDYGILIAKKPRTFASYFRDAGYLTALAQPGTTRPWPKGEYLGFEHKYYLWNFDYAGPSYSWATMPDQYVLDFMRRHELEHATRPLFMQYVLVSSHAPWSDQPEILPDWSQIGNGEIFRQMQTVHYPIVWPKFANASEAYARSIRYDFDVLAYFIGHAITDESLIIILGDHQPVSDITDGTPSHGVPVHVLSRNAALLEPFVARGYTPGLRAHRSGPRPGLDSLLPSLLADFSSKPR